MAEHLKGLWEQLGQDMVYRHQEGRNELWLVLVWRDGSSRLLLWSDFISASFTLLS